jgi:hypothetical protein
LLLKKQNVVGVERKYKKSYDNTTKFQAKWATNLPWKKGLMSERRFI